MPSTPDSTKKAPAKPRAPKKAESAEPVKKAAAAPKKKAAPEPAPMTVLLAEVETPKKAPARRKAPVKAEVAAEPEAAPSPQETMLVYVTPGERHAMICNAAYYLAERRGFVGGDPFQDWIEAEKEVDRLLGHSANQ